MSTTIRLDAAGENIHTRTHKNSSYLKIPTATTKSHLHFGEAAQTSRSPSLYMPAPARKPSDVTLDDKHAPCSHSSTLSSVNIGKISE